jgi:Domain of unknown function (DUF4468) with TBP-like fold
MKRLILIALTALTAATVKGQVKNSVQLDSIPLVDGVYQYQEVVSVDSTLSKEQLYKNAKVYFMDVFTGAKDAFQYDDKKEGRIIGKGSLTVEDYKRFFPSVTVLRWDVNYNTEIVCRDGKYSLRIYDIVVTKESHVAENNSRTVNYNIGDIYANMPKQHGAYKALYPKVLNKLNADLKARINILKESMEKKQAVFAVN